MLIWLPSVICRRRGARAKDKSKQFINLNKNTEKISIPNQL